MIKTALLISTYNWPEALELILLSLAKQTYLPHEVLIADDGSTEKTKEIIDNFRASTSIPIKHIWHEDEGFRRSKILNKTIASATSDYIIQLDGDCILHPNLVEDHIKSILPNTYLYGSRVNILAPYVSSIFQNKIIRFGIFSKKIRNKTRNLRIPFFMRFYAPHMGVSPKLRGCNISFWKKDFIAINGYNESFEGWGREDSDLATRLNNLGTKAKRIRYGGIVYHIYHPTSSKENLEQNNALLKKTKADKIIQCEKGISQYL